MPEPWSCAHSFHRCWIGVVSPTGPQSPHTPLQSFRGPGQSLLLQSRASPQACWSKAAFIKCFSTQLGFSMKQNILLKDLKINYC